VTLRRSLAFLLIPLSAVPLAAGFPLVAPSVEKRVQELRGQSTEQVGDYARPDDREGRRATTTGRDGE
jgi:hypothetical protein